MTAGLPTALPSALGDWLAANACAIDAGDVGAAEILPRLANAGITRIGVPEALGGLGGDSADAALAVAAVACESLNAAFMTWGHRCYTEFLLQTPNTGLREAQLADVIHGRVAGASALSNAMKHLAGLEPLQIEVAFDGDEIILNGKMPWVTNLRPEGFHVAAAADRAGGGPAMIIALSHDDAGLVRSDDLDLMGMRSSDTAAVTLTDVRLPRTRIISQDAPAWVPGVRPVFIGLQCGMALGLARRSIAEASACTGSGRAILADEIAAVTAALDGAEARLVQGLRDGRHVTRPAGIFELRIELAGLVQDALSLELQAGGGRCYLSKPGADFARRLREAAFIPVITPSLVQLKGVLAAARKAAA